MDAFQIAVQYFDPTIEEGLYREEPFFLSVDEVLGRPAREKPEELVGDRIPPITHLIGEPGFLFSSFFGHIAPFLGIVASPGRLRRFPNSHSILPAFRARRTRKGYRWGFGNRKTRATSQKLTVRPRSSRTTLLTRR